MAAPERMRNIHVRDGMHRKSHVWLPSMAMPHVMNKMTVVRIAVARSESTSFTPILAKTAVNAAKKADNKGGDKIFHIYHW